MILQSRCFCSSQVLGRTIDWNGGPTGSFPKPVYNCCKKSIWWEINIGGGRPRWPSLSCSSSGGGPLSPFYCRTQQSFIMAKFEAQCTYVNRVCISSPSFRHIFEVAFFRASMTCQHSIMATASRRHYCTMTHFSKKPAQFCYFDRKRERWDGHWAAQWEIFAKLSILSDLKMMSQCSILLILVSLFNINHETKNWQYRPLCNLKNLLKNPLCLGMRKLLFWKLFNWTKKCVCPIREKYILFQNLFWLLCSL